MLPGTEGGEFFPAAQACPCSFPLFPASHLFPADLFGSGKFGPAQGKNKQMIPMVPVRRFFLLYL
jgi:hypothetical protein